MQPLYLTITSNEPITQLEAILRLRGLSRKDAAKGAKVARKTVERLAHAKTEPMGSTAARLAKSLDVPVEAVLDQRKNSVWTLVAGEVAPAPAENKQERAQHDAA